MDDVPMGTGMRADGDIIPYNLNVEPVPRTGRHKGTTYLSGPFYWQETTCSKALRRGMTIIYAVR